MNPNDLLADFMNAHGVRSEHHDDWVVFPDHGKRGYARLFQLDGELRFWQLDIGIEIYPGWLVLESFVGNSEDREEALKIAFGAFVRGVLHVMLSAFFSVSPDEQQVASDQWIIAGTPRQVTWGNVDVVSWGGTPVHPGEAWFSEFETALKASALSEGTHWVRLCYAQEDGQPKLHEAMLDNETWPEMQEAMTRFTWPVAKSFCSYRLFLVIQGGVGLAEACDAICRKADDGDPVVELAAIGATPRQAALLYSLVTLAFGRYVMDGLGVPPCNEILLCELKGRLTRHTLASEPVFIEAAALAQSRGQLSKDQFVLIAMRSIEVRAVNEWLSNGAQVADLSLPGVPTIYVLGGDDRPSIFGPLSQLARALKAKAMDIIRLRLGVPPNVPR